MLNIPAAAGETLCRKSLFGKTLLILGDSYTAGYGLWDGSHGWPDLVTNALGMTQLNFSISGSTFAAGSLGNYPMVERCRELPTDVPVDVILVQGGSNDHTRDIALGEIDERNPETCCGALNLILDDLQKTYPDAQLVCFTPWISDVGGNKHGLSAQSYADAMVELCRQRGILCYDASRAEENGMYLENEDFRRRFCLSSTDRFHLNPAGHRRFAPVMTEFLSEALTGCSAADRFADLQISGDELRLGVSRVVSTGIMPAEGQLFAPARGATLQMLAESLYALSFYPPVTEQDIPGLDRNTASYRALCYSLENGLLPLSEAYPSQSPLSRQMLASALCRYYTAVCGYEIQSLFGISSYPDSDQVSEPGNTPLRWALAENLLSVKNGMLRPQSTVSRGELAETLGKFMQLLGEIS